MKSEFVMKRQRDVDTLTEVVFNLLEESNFVIIPRGGGRPPARPVDYSKFELASGQETHGRFEYRFRNGVYHVIFEMDLPQIYDKVLGIVSERYPNAVPTSK